MDFPENAVLLQALNRNARFGKSLLFRNPDAIVRADAADEVMAALHAAESWLARGFHIAGYVAYEAGYAFEERFVAYDARRNAGPLVWFGVYAGPKSAEAFAAESPESGHDAGGVIHQDFIEYSRAVRRVRSYIAEGDVYQVNYTYRARLNALGNPFSLYAALRRAQTAEYAAFIRHDDRSILSLSPEMFFHAAHGEITTRPMKGTACRGGSSSEDDALAADLRSCPKNRAENTMIVDLLRNDLGRICETGSVSVESMFDIERYETVHQMTSTIKGRLREGVSLAEIFRNLFPSGSVTGAPKIRAMEIIHELESTPRGVYTGAIGYASPNGDMLFNVAIRTLVADKSGSALGIGSGIVWDSEADDEYRECILKAGFLEAARTRSAGFQLIETLRYDGSFPLLPLHLDRLASSAEHFGFVFSHEKIRRELDAFSANPDTSVPRRVRLLLSRDGSITLQASVLQETPFPVRIGISARRVDSADPFLYHKTTRRDLYADELQSAQDRGLFDVLFRNERGEITEGCITNVFVEKNGKLLTPPVSSGLLGGVYRRHVLETMPNAYERILLIEDLRSSDRIFVCNAVRGMMPAILAEQAEES